LFGLVFFFPLYRTWKQLGGIEHYVPPDRGKPDVPETAAGKL
jgi:hypothetical protein